MMKKKQIYSKIFLTVLIGMASLFMLGCSEEKPEACYIEVYTDYPVHELLTQSKATLTGNITIQSGTVTEYGFYLSNKRAELVTAAVGAKKVINKGNYSGNISLSYSATGLTPGTPYYCRAFASNGTSTFYGEIVEFETKQPSVPVLGELLYSDVTDNSVALICSIFDVGVEETNTITYGFEYKKSDEANWTRKTDGVQKSEDGSFYVTLSGLSSETEYYVRAFARNNYGEGYSRDAWFTTNEKLTPVIRMDDIAQDNISATGVKVSGYIETVYSKDGVVTEVGFLYGTSPDMTYASAENSIKVEPKDGNYGKNGTFTVELINKFKPESTYYICPYAKDEGSDGIQVYGYGEVRSFTTRQFERPYLDYMNAEPEDYNSISVSVNNLSYDGTLVEYGFIWGKYSYYDNIHEELMLENCGENKMTFTPSTDDAISAFSAVIESLETNTYYIIKAYAISACEVDGKMYQSEPGYTTAYCSTEDLNTPTLNYIQVDKSSYTTLTVSSGLNFYDEKATVTECGFIWTDYKTYEGNDYKLNLENCGENKIVTTLDENNAFAATLTGLSIGTYYQLAAYVTVTYPDGATRTGYATNSYSTSSMYIYVNIDNIGTDSFKVTGSAGSSWGTTDWSELGETFEGGFCWSTNGETNPVDIPEENRVTAELIDSGGQKTFTSTITVPEESGVTYYVWSYLKYEDGIIYSSVTSVTSKHIPSKEDHGDPTIKD